MRKFIYSLFLTVMLGIPLSANATIVDDPDVFNFSPFYDPSSGVIGLSLTFFPSEEGDTVYIPDYIYENNQYKYVVCINTGAFYDCHAKYIRLPNHLRFIRDNAFHYCCFLTTLEFTNDISEIDFGEIDDIVGGCNYVDEIIVPKEYIDNYIDDPEDRFFGFYINSQLKFWYTPDFSVWDTFSANYNYKVEDMTACGYSINGSLITPIPINGVIPANTGVLIGTNGLTRGKIVKTIESPTNITCSTLTPQLNAGIVSTGTSQIKNYLLDDNRYFTNISGYLAGNKAYLTVNNGLSLYYVNNINY
jgi:hypothetical protein